MPCCCAAALTPCRPRQSLLVARMDVTHEPAPKDIHVSTLPVIVMFPAFEKLPPYQYYSGVSKVRPAARGAAGRHGWC